VRLAAKAQHWGLGGTEARPSRKLLRALRAPERRMAPIGGRCVEPTWFILKRPYWSRQSASLSSPQRFRRRRPEIQPSLCPRILRATRNPTCRRPFMNRVNHRRRTIYLGKRRTRFPVAGPTVRLRPIHMPILRKMRGEAEVKITQATNTKIRPTTLRTSTKFNPFHGAALDAIVRDFERRVVPHQQKSRCGSRITQIAPLSGRTPSHAVTL
jgi:hypothetical protein